MSLVGFGIVHMCGMMLFSGMFEVPDVDLLGHVEVFLYICLFVLLFDYVGELFVECVCYLCG